MKAIFLTVTLALATAFGAKAQGTLNFNNFVPGAFIDAPIFDVGGSTRLEGTAFLAQLYAGPDAGSLVAVGSSVPFFTGAGAGYINPAPDSTRSVAAVAPGATAVVVVRAWDAAYATYEIASTTFGAKSGQSAPINVVTGGSGMPPSVPSSLTGLASFSLVVVPEPSTIALGLLGAAAIILRRRKV